MGVLDWLGPLSRSNKRSPWDLGAVSPAPAPHAKSLPLTLSLPPEMMSRPLTYEFTSETWLGGSAACESNSAVFACLQAIAQAIAEPEIKLFRREPSVGDVEVEDAALARLFTRPNPHMSLDTLLAYVSTCLHVAGNAYWRKLRAGDAESGPVVELWPIAPYAISPYTVPGGDDFISYYRYGSERIATTDIVHFRYGLDDRDHRLGAAPLTRLLREASSDAQATRYSERLLANLAINGLTLTFDSESPPLTQEMADELKARIQSAYGGDNVGAVSVLSPGATLTALGFSPEQMDLKVLHRVPEERIAAVLGVPAIVAGLGAGLDRATYANFREAREAFTETKLLPLWASLASTITLQLLPDFATDPSLVVAFDTADVRALADDANALAERLKVLVESGILTTDEARAEIGYDPLPAAMTEPSPARLDEAASRRRAALRSISLKAADDLPDRYAELRAEMLPDWERELTSYLASQQRRATRRLAAGADDALDLIPESEAILLGETLVPLQTVMLGDVSRLVVSELGFMFTVDDPATRAFLRSCGVNIVGITDTTRDAVRAELTAGQMAGEGIAELARRLRDLPAFSSARARVVARTELGTSQNLAALAAYRASGVVVGVRVHDGDYDAECEAMDGRTFALDQAPPPLQHPNCVRAFAPLTEPSELTASA